MILLLLFFVACAWATRCCKGCTLQRPKLRPRCPVNQAWCVVLSSWGSCPSFVYCVGHCYIRRVAAAVTAFTRYCAETCPQAAHTPRGKYGGCARFVCQDGFLYSYEKREMLCGFSQNAMFPVLCGFGTNGWCGPPPPFSPFLFPPPPPPSPPLTAWHELLSPEGFSEPYRGDTGRSRQQAITDLGVK